MPDAKKTTKQSDNPQVIDARKLFWILLNVALLTLVIGLGYGVRALNSYSNSLSPARVINVSAEGKTVAVPDIAKFNFSVVSEGDAPADIQAENSKKINDAMAFIEGQGVEEKDIKTTSYNLSPKYKFDKFKNRSDIIGYTLRQSVEVRIRDFALISTILAGLPGLGINEIGQLNFDIDDPDVYLDQAREEAFAKAKEKAEKMASQNRVSIRKVVSFSESPTYYPARFESFLSVAESAPAPVIQPGEQEITVRINVTYEIQ